MSSLLIQSCSQSKNRPTEAVPALDLYTGYFFKIIKKAIRENEFDGDIDLCILSAEYGIIERDEEISWYDRRIDSERAEELSSKVAQELTRIVDSSYDKLLINVGRDYLEALSQVMKELTVPVYYIEGSGIGKKGSVLKGVIRGETDVENSNRIIPLESTNVSR